MTSAISRAASDAGGNVGLAKALGVHPSFISQLITGRRRLPLSYCQKIEELYGISKHDLRPDVFGAKQGAA